MAIAAATAALASGCAVLDAFGDGDDEAPPDVIDPDRLSCDPLPDLVVHFPFEEGSGEKAGDVSGAENDGELKRMDENGDWVTGRIGLALDFDGDDDHIEVDPSVSIADLLSLSTCAWILPRSIPDAASTIADKSLDGSTGGWSFFIEEGGRIGFLTNHRQFAIGAGVVLGTWQHACAVWDGTPGTSGISLYLDGRPLPIVDAGANGKAVDSDAALSLFLGRANTDALTFEGRMDDYQLYQRALSPPEVDALFRCADEG